MNVTPANTLVASALALILITGAAFAETVMPLNGQAAAQAQADISACKAQSGYTGTQPAAAPAEPAPQGGRARGAATAAVAGAAAAEARGNQHAAYGKASEDAQQAYRQNNAKDAAAAGAVVGGAKQRQGRREAAQQQQAATASTNAQQGYANCLNSKGYSVSF